MRFVQALSKDLVTLTGRIESLERELSERNGLLCSSSAQDSQHIRQEISNLRQEKDSLLKQRVELDDKLRRGNLLSAEVRSSFKHFTTFELSALFRLGWMNVGSHILFAVMLPGGANCFPVGRGHRGSGCSDWIQEWSHHPEAEAAQGFSQHALPVGNEPHGQAQLSVCLWDQSSAVQVLWQGLSNAFSACVLIFSSCMIKLKWWTRSAGRLPPWGGAQAAARTDWAGNAAGRAAKAGAVVGKRTRSCTIWHWSPANTTAGGTREEYAAVVAAVSRWESHNEPSKGNSLNISPKTGCCYHIYSESNCL